MNNPQAFCTILDKHTQRLSLKFWCLVGEDVELLS
jgi:hypothetical protein